MKLVVVTATTNPEQARSCMESWGDVHKVVVVNNASPLPSADRRADPVTWLTYDEYLGSVSAFRRGTDFVLDRIPDADIIACLHDDLEIQDADWQKKVIRHFEKVPSCGLLGFGGAIGLGDADIYQKPYAPTQLARIGFRSNLRDAEVHGVRSLISEEVACLDGFSQIGRREFWLGQTASKQWTGTPGQPDFKFLPTPRLNDTEQRPWTVLEDLGIVHHLYDGLLGAIAARYGWETWYLPIRCHHYGGRTAVGDVGYQQWATDRIAGGDHGFWEAAHRIGYDSFKDVLPLRT